MWTPPPSLGLITPRLLRPLSTVRCSRNGSRGFKTGVTSKFDGVEALTAALVRRPERFANTVAEKLLVYALGRGLEYYDMPAVRKIVSDSAPDYKLQSMILGVVKSYPFLMRRAGARPPQNPGAVASVQFSHP